MAQFDVLIVGTGQAGAQAAASLRSGGFSGSIGLVGEQSDPPYELPPLSKDYLAGEKTFDQILLRPADFWAERDITLLLGQAATAVDAKAHVVTRQDGSRLGYGQLIWAAGGHARSLTCTGGDLRGVHSIRNRRDVDRLRQELAIAKRVVVIGGGYIGLEAAAVLAKSGKPVVVIEAQDRVLARVAGEALSRFYEREHRAHGVEIRTEASVSQLIGHDGWVAGVVLSDSEVISADLVIVGIGIVPAAQPLLAAGAAGGDGVNVDAYCRTTLPDVLAIGDVAAHENRFADGRRLRLESVQNANDQAQVVARLINGEAKSYDAVPWFWSNQYDLRLQTVGLSAGFDETILRGDPLSRAFSVIYLRGGRVVALDCVNATKDYVQGKALVLRGDKPVRERIADPAIPLKEV